MLYSEAHECQHWISKCYLDICFNLVEFWIFNSFVNLASVCSVVFSLFHHMCFRLHVVFARIVSSWHRVARISETAEHRMHRGSSGTAQLCILEQVTSFAVSSRLFPLLREPLQHAWIVCGRGGEWNVVLWSATRLSHALAISTRMFAPDKNIPFSPENNQLTVHFPMLHLITDSISLSNSSILSVILWSL